MKFKIDKNGWLSIEKRGVLKEQFCVYKEDVHCGEHCPCFFISDTVDNGVVSPFLYLKLCKNEFRICLSDIIIEESTK